MCPITDDQKYILDNLAGNVAGTVKLGTLIKDASGAFTVVYAGKHTTTGGAAAEDVTITGALASDIVVVTLDTVGATPRTVVTAKAASNKVTVTFSGDPSTDHVVQYVVLRAAA